MTSPRPRKREWHEILTTQGINRELWKWLRAHATVENTTVGELINGLIEDYRNDVRMRSGDLEMTSGYSLEPANQHSIRGIDRDMWQWLRAQAILQDKFLCELLNELIYRKMVKAGVP